ncbi:MAG TPA: beta-propeller fold lactonase family protein [Steroidobacteraceae bacterium]|nr:beta-propeller fold lactonase family protein [Steroidobacteraceae bacterium]
MMAIGRKARFYGLHALGFVLAAWLPLTGQAAPRYQVYVTNERSGDVTIIDGNGHQVLGTIPVGKRPRGIHASPDGKTVYVALSGTPIAAPPQLDAKGNPIFQRGKDDDDEDSVKADKSADAIGVVDVAQRKLTGKISAGSDPEEFSLSKDGRRIYVSNEDVKTASVIDIATGKVEHIVAVSQEPEGVATAPDGKRFYVTCEAGGDVYAVETAGYTTVGHFKVNVRPRSMDFLPNGDVGFVPSESTGELNVVDTAALKVMKVIALPAGSRPMSVKVSLDGRRVYVSNGRAGTVSVLDSRTYELLNTIKVGTRPWGMALSPDGKFLYTANGPSNDVSVVDLEANVEVARVKAGASPWAVAVVPNAP